MKSQGWEMSKSHAAGACGQSCVVSAPCVCQSVCQSVPAKAVLVPSLRGSRRRQQPRVLCKRWVLGALSSLVCWPSSHANTVGWSGYSAPCHPLETACQLFPTPCYRAFGYTSHVQHYCMASQEPGGIVIIHRIVKVGRDL